MIRSVATKYAFRSLFTHTRRTFLSVIGVGIGCSIALFATSWISGGREMQIRAIAESGAGHLRIVPTHWLDTRENTLRLTDWQGVVQQARALPEVKTALARARTNALLAFGNRSAGVQVVGVEPDFEPQGNRILQTGVLQGRYLKVEDKNAVVIGKTLAKRLDVELEDDLYATLSARNDITSVMLHIVGIMETGSRDIDSMFCQVTLQNLAELTQYPGASEIALLLHDYTAIPAVQRTLASAMPKGNEVITWQEVNPAMAGGIEGDRAFSRGLIAIIISVVALGIASAQLTAVLQRRTEFAILSALGMRRRQIIALVMIEALFIGLGGAVVALMVGGAGAYYLATEGVSLAAIMGEGVELAFGDVLLEPHIYGSFGPWLIGYAFLVSLLATVSASMYPAWMATKVNPADALRSI